MSGCILHDVSVKNVFWELPTGDSYGFLGSVSFFIPYPLTIWDYVIALKPKIIAY